MGPAALQSLLSIGKEAILISIMNVLSFPWFHTQSHTVWVE